MARLSLGVMVLALTGCGDKAEVQDGSCRGVMRHMRDTLSRTKTSYMAISLSESDCEQMSPATRSCIGAIKSGADLLACAKGDPKVKAEVDRDIGLNLDVNRRVAAYESSRYIKADREWRDQNPTATTCPTLVQLKQQPSSPHNLRDPWGSEYVVKCDANRSEVFSSGPDKTPGTEDDIGAGWVDPQR